MSREPSRMCHEILEIPDAVERLLSQGEAALSACASDLRELNPSFLVTVARGSSDHAATFLKYASELLLGLPVASVGPSVASIYKAPLRLKGSVCLSISQSGQSPDIVSLANESTRSGALTIAITNKAESPLAKASKRCLDIHAGPELSVAATKSFITSIVTGLMLLAIWKKDQELIRSIKGLPEALAQAVRLDWAELRASLNSEESLFTLGRGPAFAISNEAALKFKETCQIHAESYSSAEVLHGPVSIIGQGFPVIGFTAADAAETGLADVADTIASRGGAVFITSDKARQAKSLPSIRTSHPLTDPVTLMASFYTMVEKVALERGINPDTPRHLNKVTETL